MPILPLINPEETRVQFESTTPRPRLTVGILTLNEEKRIASCAQSARFVRYAVIKYDPKRTNSLAQRS